MAPVDLFSNSDSVHIRTGGLKIPVDHRLSGLKDFDDHWLPSSATSRSLLMYRSSGGRLRWYTQQIAAVWSPSALRFDFVKPLPDISHRTWHTLPSQKVLLLEHAPRMSWRSRSNGPIQFRGSVISPSSAKPMSVPVNFLLPNFLGPHPVTRGFCPISGMLLVTNNTADPRTDILCSIYRFQ